MDNYIWVEVAPGRQKLMKESDLNRSYDEPPVTPALHGVKVLDEATRWSLRVQTGRDIKTTADLRRYCRENGSRVVERGDKVDKAHKSMQGQDNEDQLRKRHESVKKGHVPYADPTAKFGT